jgi:hypothetical protein
MNDTRRSDQPGRIMTGVSGKAEGRCLHGDGPVGRFTLTDRGRAAAWLWASAMSLTGCYATADGWRPGAWLVTARGGHWWALPPADAEHAMTDPDYLPVYRLPEGTRGPD